MYVSVCLRVCLCFWMLCEYAFYVYVCVCAFIVECCVCMGESCVCVFIRMCICCCLCCVHTFVRIPHCQTAAWTRCRMHEWSMKPRMICFGFFNVKANGDFNLKSTEWPSQQKNKMNAYRIRLRSALHQSPCFTTAESPLAVSREPPHKNLFNSSSFSKSNTAL